MFQKLFYSFYLWVQDIHFYLTIKQATLEWSHILFHSSSSSSFSYSETELTYFKISWPVNYHKLEVIFSPDSVFISCIWAFSCSVLTAPVWALWLANICSRHGRAFCHLVLEENRFLNLIKVVSRLSSVEGQVVLQSLIWCNVALPARCAIIYLFFLHVQYRRVKEYQVKSHQMLTGSFISFFTQQNSNLACLCLQKVVTMTLM